MSSIHLHSEEIAIKVVYYGPGLGGKTSSLQYLHSILKPENRGRLISLATGIDRTLYFDFLPINLPRIRNFSVRMSLYTVPGQVHYNATRKLVLQGADGVIFVADSQESRRDANIESMINLQENLREEGLNPDTVPLVLQYNKRDIENVMPVHQLNPDLNPREVPFFETNATSGKGVFEALKTITRIVISELQQKSTPRSPESSKETSFSSDAMEDPSPQENIKTTLQTELTKPATLADAIAHHAREISGLQPAAPPVPQYGYVDLWNPCPARNGFRTLENRVQKGDYHNIIRETRDLLRQHLGDCGDTHATLLESLFVLGVSNVHFSRFSTILDHNEDTVLSRSDALFCLFMLTDVELRLQAAGLRH